MKQVLRDAPRNATYRSKFIQNQIIDTLAVCIKDKIIGDIKKTKYFSIMGDEASDISNKEQMSIVIRYLTEDMTIKEKFLEFVHCDEGTSGAALANKIEKAVTGLGNCFFVLFYRILSAS